MSGEVGGSSSSSTPLRGWGRGSRGSRGGYGKYLRARGRGRGRGGRPAEFCERLFLEGDKPIELDPESEEAKESARRFAKRQLGSNADRYKEPEPELNSDGEADVEPDVDLSSFLARQRLEDESASTVPGYIADGKEDVDHSLVHLAPKAPGETASKFKGKVEQIELDDELKALMEANEEKVAIDDLKNRFRSKEERQRMRGMSQHTQRTRHKVDDVKEAPPLPDERPPKNEIEQMEEFLDDLLG